MSQSAFNDSNPAKEDEKGRREQAREGTLDAQLSLTDALAGLPQPIPTIVKRDGRLDPFSALKIAATIERAGIETREIDRDTSFSLASAVALFLASANQNEHSVSADEVHGAVERVLLEMGYNRTAQCYLRHGQSRRWEDTVRGGAEASPGDSTPSKQFHDVSLWDWIRTQHELQSNCGLDRNEAEDIINEVRHQLEAAKLGVFTHAVVRELVRAEMLHRGLDALQPPGAHLEVSLHDTERIIAGPALFGTAIPSDPDGSSRLLAARVKSEFALLRVYSNEVAAAHNRADIFIHDLGAVDRLYSIAPSMERLKRFGMETAEGRQRSLAAKEPDTLVAQLTGQTTALRPYFSGPVTWEGLNFSLAPYAHQLDAEALSDLAKVLLYEFAFRALSESDLQNRTHYSLHWDVPQHMFGAEMTGPGGALTERTCEDYIRTAQDLALAILETHRDISELKVPLPSPVPIIHITPHALAHPEQRQFLDSVCGLISSGNEVSIRCDSDSPLLPHAGDLLSPVGLVAHRTTLNLPRAALRRRDETGLFAELDRMVDRALQGHMQKRNFLQTLVGREGSGPLGLLASSRNGHPMVELPNATFVVGVLGLNECVLNVTGSQLHESPEATDLAEAILRHLRNQCDQWSEGLGTKVSLEPTHDSQVAAQFAMADVDVFDTQPAPSKNGIEPEQIPRYTAGAATAETAPLTPIERVQLESRSHGYFHDNACCDLPSSGFQHRPDSIAEFLAKAFLETPCRGIRFS